MIYTHYVLVHYAACKVVNQDRPLKDIIKITYGAT